MGLSVSVTAVQGDQPGDHLEISERSAAGIGYDGPEACTVNFGRSTAHALIRTGPQTGDRAVLSTALMKRLLIPAGARLGLSFNAATATLRLGPCVGVYLRDAFIQQLGSGHISSNVHELTRANTEGRLDCHLYFFGPSDVDLVEEQIMGYNLIAGHWRRDLLPFPDVLYDRASGFAGSKREIVRAFRKRLVELDIPRINAVDKLSKWATHRVLNKEPDIAAHLPHTIKVREFADVIKMLQKHPRIYLKGDGSNLGRRAMLVATLGGRFETYTYRGPQTVGTPTQLECLVSSLMGNHRYVAQQAIPLMHIGDRVFDLRVQQMKNGRNDWTTVYSVARIARPKVSITNHALGSDLAKAVDAIHQAGFSHSEADLINETATDLAVRVARCLDRKFGPLGDLGVDIGLDTEGKPWVFEVNSKPSRFSPILPRSAGPLPEFLNILEYATLLAGF